MVQMGKRRGMLVILSSPSGAGKTTLTRRLMASPRAESTEKIAAASVEPTIAPSNKPCSQVKPNIHTTNTAMTPAVIATPTVANTMPGPIPTRTVRAWVRIPPSKRMMPSAMQPIR